MLPDAQDAKTLYWQRYDVDLTVLTNGDLRVEETQELVFTDRHLPIRPAGDHAESRCETSPISPCAKLNGPAYRQSENDEEYTYRIIRDSNSVKVRYNFPPSPDMRRTIVIGYTVKDGLRYYPDKGVDQLFWKAIPAGNPFPTKNAVITLHVPAPATFTNYGVYGAPATANFQPGQRDATMTVGAKSGPGKEVEALRNGSTASWPVRRKAWQQALDQETAQKAVQEEQKQRWGPVADLSFLALAGLLLHRRAGAALCVVVSPGP